MKYFLVLFYSIVMSAASGLPGSETSAAAPETAPSLTPPLRSPSAMKPLDVQTPPFSEFDFSWINGSNRQPSSLLTIGPLTWSAYLDAFYAYQFSNPIDHTIFPTTVASRHNEVAINLATVGFDVTGLDGPIGRLYFQAGTNAETDAGQDTTVNRGQYLTTRSQLPIQQAAAGWHFHVLDGINLEFGIFPSYIGLESYLPQENWNYLRPFISDFTPYYFNGSRTQIFITPKLKFEFWLVNGWQTVGKNNDGFGEGYILHWRPTGNLVLSNSFYTGTEEQRNPLARRYYTDNFAQWLYFKGSGGSLVKTSALCVVADYGYETRGDGNPNGPIYGAAISNRLTFSEQWAFTLRYDYFYDKTQALIIPLPVSTGYALPDNGSFLGSGETATIDFTPSPWIIYRLEYMHRNASVPYFSGSGGITGPGGYPVSSSNPGPFTPDLERSDDRAVVNLTLRL